MKKVLSFLLVIFLLFIAVSLVSCGSDKNNDIPTIDDGDTMEHPSTNKDDTTPPDTETHDHVYFLTVIVPPSCGVEGKQAYVCDICGKKQHETSIEALQHNYHYSSEFSIAPTCTTAGIKVEHCYNCGENKDEVLDATGHKWHTKSSCDSNTNELIITPYCTRCSLTSDDVFRYKVNDVTTLVNESYNLFAELGGTIITGNNVSHTYKAPYYGVYCSETYILIVRNTKSFAAYAPDGAILNDSPMNYYRGRGCAVVYEADIIIDESGTIKILNHTD